VPGKDDAFAEYASARWLTLVRTALALGCTLSESEDLAQTTLLKVYVAWGKVVKADHRDAYVSKILVNAHRDSHRRRWRRETPPIDSTAERFSQDTTPDLELIRERGFVEDYVNMFAGAEGSCDAGSPGNLVDQAPTFQAWYELRSAWVRVERAVLADEQVTALKQPLAQCLERRSGLTISARNPATSYLSAVDGAESDNMPRLASIYADCGREYFAMVQTLMLAERPLLVEKHREVLETFAHEVVALGYGP
jgi:DNA-directed RNA polymerase specialized sigma24 family protein